MLRPFSLPWQNIEMSKFAIWLGEKLLTLAMGTFLFIWIPLAMFISQLLIELREKQMQRYPNDKKNKYHTFTISTFARVKKMGSACT